MIFHVFNENFHFLIMPQLIPLQDGQYGTVYYKKYCKEFLFFTHAGILVLRQNYAEFIIKI